MFSYNDPKNCYKLNQPIASKAPAIMGFVLKQAWFLGAAQQESVRVKSVHS